MGIHSSAPVRGLGQEVCVYVIYAEEAVGIYNWVTTPPEVR